MFICLIIYGFTTVGRSCKHHCLLHLTLNCSLFVTVETPDNCTCVEGYVACADCSRCIPEDQWCDEEYNCPSGDDEQSCSCQYGPEGTIYPVSLFHLKLVKI